MAWRAIRWSKFFPVVAVVVSSALTVDRARAQDDAQDGPPPLEAEQASDHAPPLPPPLPSAGPSEATSPPTIRWACLMGEHPGIAEPDAKTATTLVCGELAKAGPTPGAEYRVHLGKLGTLVVLSVESNLNGVHDQRQMSLTSLEEIPVAAPRVAYALTHGVPVGQTEKVDNIVGLETRTPKTKPGSVHMGVGVLAVMPPIREMGAPVPGFEIELHYETTRFAAGMGTRFAWGTPSDTKLNYAAVDIRGRYYLTSDDVAPFVGTGLAWSGLVLRQNMGFSGRNGGIGMFGELGVEALRTHKCHLTLGLRLDAPFYSLEGRFRPAGYTGRKYYSPLSLALTFTF